MKRTCMKRAESTVEIALAIMLSVVVLYLILNLFGGNIKTVVENSGIGRMLHKNNELAKTKWDPDPTKTQMNIQIVADQGSLAQYHGDAAATIERYEAESHTETLTPENIQNLALQLTIFAESGPSGKAPLAFLLQEAKFAKNPALSYYKFAHNNGITVFDDGPSITSFTEVQRPKYVNVKWGSAKKGDGADSGVYNEYAGNNYTSQEGTSLSPERSLRVKNIEGIKKCFKEQYKL